MNVKFRLLRADEIDVRVGNTNKDKDRANLLLYKDARCDMNVLDETVGPLNWQRSHNRDNANCVVSIWDDEKRQWISKEDTGTESKTEAEKGLASDSFKRACFNWGIGRELYSAPSIWVPYDKDKYESYSVAEIGYNDNREINRLAIKNKAGKIIFSFGLTTAKGEAPQEEAPADPKDAPAKMPSEPRFDPLAMIQNYCQQNEMTGKEFTAARDACISAGLIPRIAYNNMTEEQCCKMIEVITLNRVQEVAS